MKENLKRFFTINIKKNFIKYKFGYGVAIGVVIACIWCIIGIYAAPYIVQATKTFGAKEIAHADVTTINANQKYEFEDGTYNNNNYTLRILSLANYSTVGANASNTDIGYSDLTNWAIIINGNTYPITNFLFSCGSNSWISYYLRFSNYDRINFTITANQKTLSYDKYQSGQGYTSQDISNSTIIIQIGSLSTENSNTPASTARTKFLYNLKYAVNEYNETYNITYNITNGSGSPLTIQPNTTNTLQITPDTGYTYPTTISYIGTAADVQYYNETGEIIITNPTSEFTITAACREYTHTISSGYYLIYPPNLPYEDEALEIEFKIIDLLYGEMPTTEPLNIAISTDTYHLLYRTQRQLNNGLLALRSLNDQNPRELWGDYQQDYLRGAIVISVTSDCEYTGANNIAESLYSITADDLEELRYWGYGIARSHATIGYDEGFNNGYTDGVNNQIIGQTTSSIISQIFSGLFGNVLSVEIFPGFPIYIFILVPIVFALIGLLLWLIRGK